MTRKANDKLHLADSYDKLARACIASGDGSWAEFATALLDMTAEVKRLNHVIDGIVAMYTAVDKPLADYLGETGDMR